MATFGWRTVSAGSITYGTMGSGGITVTWPSHPHLILGGNHYCCPFTTVQHSYVVQANSTLNLTINTTSYPQHSPGDIATGTFNSWGTLWYVVGIVDSSRHSWPLYLVSTSPPGNVNLSASSNALTFNGSTTPTFAAIKSPSSGPPWTVILGAYPGTADVYF